MLESRSVLDTGKVRGDWITGTRGNILEMIAMFYIMIEDATGLCTFVRTYQIVHFRMSRFSINKFDHNEAD
jgi:hypothetical protein